ncbi:DEAD/DEAH box helicase family protein, partial [Candidatus Bathyarchaeota archaeon]|nr:DEAD/DEAH box helicase family protein [Candidatus Bathyarchaeota archaeon]
MYQESNDEEEVEDYLEPDYAGEEYVDTRPYIEKVMRHRPKDDVQVSIHSRRQDFEYFIKWQEQSHLHDTWETPDTLKDVRGYRRLENYFRKIVEYELDITYSDDTPPESREQYFLDREKDMEALEDYTQVERVVAVRTGENGTEYYVKWKGLAYDECTWELASEISPEFQDKIDQFLDRSSRSWVSDRKESSQATRSKMVRLEEQPDYVVGGELREFQLKGLNFLCLNWTRANNVILADEMGLGKTVQSVAFLSWLRNERLQEGPFLVVAPLSVIPAWCDTFNHWAPDLNYVVYLGPDKARRIIRDNELLVDGNPKKPKFNVLVTSYDYILTDWQFLGSIKWQVLAVDEAHRLKNAESQLYAKLFNFGVPSKVLITGTPIQNNLGELAALLDFLNPGKVSIGGDLESLSASDTQVELNKLHQAIQPYIIRRTKETVESDLPPKTERILRVILSDIQLEYYKNVLTRNYSALRDASGQNASLLNVMMELKKISNHPYMFPGVEERVLAGSTRREDHIKGLITSSGKMVLLDSLLTKLKRDGHRVLIFSQMVKMLDILGDYLSFRGYKFQRLDGTIAAGPRRMAINHFNADGSEDFCFLLSTRAGGLGINLMTADTVILFDSDWNPQADLQAMARAHRIGQKKPVNIYRFVSKETVEEEILERARNKLLLEYLAIQAGVTDDGQAFREEFNMKGLKVDGPSSAQDIQQVLKMRSRGMFEQTDNREQLEHLDIDSVLANAEVTKTKVDDKINLSTGGINWDNWMQVHDVEVDHSTLDWDKIIPQDELDRIRADEEKKKHEDYLAKVAEENAPRRAAAKNRNGESDDRTDRLAKKRQRELEKEQEHQQKRAALKDPKRPLTEKEQRNLIRAFLRFGCMDERGDEIMQDAKLADRNREFIKKFVSDLVQACQQAVDGSQSNPADKDAESSKAAGKKDKKDKKAILFDFGDLKKVNAETPLERPPQLRLLRQVIKAQGEWRTFRLPEATK